MSGAFAPADGYCREDSSLACVIFEVVLVLC